MTEIRHLDVNGVRLRYEFTGPSGAPVVMPIMGFVDQLDCWPEGVVSRLNAAGYRVLRFETRDCGGSSNLDALGIPDLLQFLTRDTPITRADIPYGIEDLAADARQLAEALGVSQAHVVGYSMGGFVAQDLAVYDAEFVASMVLLMTSSRAPDLPAWDPRAAEASQALLQPEGTPDQLEAAYAGLIEATNGSIYRHSPEGAREKARSMVACGLNGRGAIRQLAATFPAPRALPELGKLNMPVTVIQGAEDGLFPPGHGEDLQQRIPGARLEVIEGAGHGLTPNIVDKLSDILIEHLRRADQGTS